MANGVSVVIATMGRPELLRKCLKSTIDSDYPDLEIVVVEDPSEKGYATQQLQSEFKMVDFVRNIDRFGIAGSRNIGIRRASGRYIFFLDDDNILESSCISTLVKTMKERKDVGFIGPVSYYASSPRKIWNAGVRVGRITRRHFNIRETPINRPYDVDVIPNAYMTKREVLEKVGLFDEKNFYIQEEEHDLQFRAFSAGYHLVIEPAARVWHEYFSKNFIRLTPQIAYDIWRSRIVFEKKHNRINSWFFPVLAFFAYLPYYSFKVLIHSEIYPNGTNILVAMFNGFGHGLIHKVRK